MVGRGYGQGAGGGGGGMQRKHVDGECVMRNGWDEAIAAHHVTLLLLCAFSKMIESAVILMHLRYTIILSKMRRMALPMSL